MVYQHIPGTEPLISTAKRRKCLIGGLGSQATLKPRDRDKVPALGDIFKTQPSQFRPRLDWNHWNASEPTLLNIEDTPDNRKQVADHPGQVKTGEGESTTNHGDGPSGVGRDVLWWELMANMARRNAPTSRGLQAMMAIIADGMQSTVAVARTYISITSSRLLSNPAAESPNYAVNLVPKATLVEGTVTMGFATANDFRSAVKDRRFLIGLVELSISKTVTYATFILDIPTGAVYIYCPFSNGQTDACRLSLLALRQALAWAGLPTALNLYAPPVTTVDAESLEWAGGLVCIFLLLLNVRGLVGATYPDVERSLTNPELHKIAIENRSKKNFRAPDTPFELPQRDWVLHQEWEKEEKPADPVRALLGTIIMDQMGIPTREYMNGADKCDIATWTKMSTTYTAIRKTSDLPQQTGGFYTSLGGVQIMTWEGIDIAPCDGASRIVNPPPDTPCSYESSAEAEVLVMRKEEPVDKTTLVTHDNSQVQSAGGRTESEEDQPPRQTDLLRLRTITMETIPELRGLDAGQDSDESEYDESRRQWEPSTSPDSACWDFMPGGEGGSDDDGSGREGSGSDDDGVRREGNTSDVEHGVKRKFSAVG
ncbi:hypothetical protein FDECE_2489 [Fusarium decemcellulare]|nr:hypothetical protein FDECE_2489 [Fusarium decemcellulare]